MKLLRESWFVRQRLRIWPSTASPWRSVGAGAAAAAVVIAGNVN